MHIYFQWRVFKLIDLIVYCALASFLCSSMKGARKGNIPMFPGQIYFSLIFTSITSLHVFHYSDFFSRESTLFFCLKLISSKLFQPKAQGQKQIVASREIIRQWKTGLTLYCTRNMRIQPDMNSAFRIILRGGCGDKVGGCGEWSRESQTRPDFGGNSGRGGKNLGEVQRSGSRPPWKFRA